MFWTTGTRVGGDLQLLQPTWRCADDRRAVVTEAAKIAAQRLIDGGLAIKPWEPNR
jgi:hypothetical protein